MISFSRWWIPAALTVFLTVSLCRTARRLEDQDDAIDAVVFTFYLLLLSLASGMFFMCMYFWGGP